MRLFFILFCAFITIAYPSFATDPYSGQMTTPTCETYPEWMGSKIEDIDLSKLKDRPHRILKPDSMATMDYLPDRLNIHTTQDGVIINQDCG